MDRINIQAELKYFTMDNGVPSVTTSLIQLKLRLSVAVWDSLGIMEDPLSYFSLQPVLYDWCNKGRGMCYPVWGMVHIKYPLLLIGMNSQASSSGFS